MRLTRTLFKLNTLSSKMEFSILLCWLLFFPLKESVLYVPSFIFLMVILLFRSIYFMRNIGISSFSYSLLAFNLAAMISIFFAIYRYPSISWVSGILLISAYFFFFFLAKADEEDYFRLLIYIISVVSLFQVIEYMVPGIDWRNFFFPNPILQGVSSGIAVIAAFYYLLQKFQGLLLGLLVLNAAGLYVSESKAAFIGTAGICLLMVLLKKKKLVPLTAGIIILTFIIPNPIRDMFVFSIKKDPYAANRLDMWKMSLDIYKGHAFFGVGPGNFPEVTRKYNFKQTKGPANYFKRTQSPHNDYLKILCEMGIPGLIFILFFTFVLAKRIFLPPIFNLSKLLILYLLFQALLFDVIFHFFFLFIFFFLLKNLFEGRLIYKSFTLPLKIYAIFLLIFTFMVGFLLPYFSHQLIVKSQQTRDIVRRFDLLNKAEYVNSLDAQVYYLKSIALYHYFRESNNLESFYSALKKLKEAQRLNPYFIDTYRLESDIYTDLFQKKINYMGLCADITAPLTSAEQYDPLNPFIKLRKAEIFLLFDLRDKAREEAIEALELEPEYAAALYFLQTHFNYFEDEDFERKIARIQEKNLQYKPESGTYLYELFKIPIEKGR